MIRSIPAPNSKKYLNFIENSRYVRKENAYFDREKYSLLNWRKKEDEEDGEKRNDSSNEFSLSLSLSPQFYPSESLSQSLYRFPRIKLVLIVSRRASYFRPREHHPSVEIKRATSSSRMPNRQKRYLFHPPSTVISHREHLLVKMEFSYSQRDPIRSWTDGRANGMRDTRSSEIRFLDTLEFRFLCNLSCWRLSIKPPTSSRMITNDDSRIGSRGVCVCVCFHNFVSKRRLGRFLCHIVGQGYALHFDQRTKGSCGSATRRFVRSIFSLCRGKSLTLPRTTDNRENTSLLYLFPIPQVSCNSVEEWPTDKSTKDGDY